MSQQTEILKIRIGVITVDDADGETLSIDAKFTDVRRGRFFDDAVGLETTSTLVHRISRVRSSTRFLSSIDVLVHSIVERNCADLSFSIFSALLDLEHRSRRRRRRCHCRTALDRRLTCDSAVDWRSIDTFETLDHR
jgi:hypothetical protein